MNRMFAVGDLDPDLGADDRLHARRGGLFGKTEGAVHVGVVGQGESRDFEPLRFGNQRLHVARAGAECEVAVDAKVREGCHRNSRYGLKRSIDSLLRGEGPEGFA